MAELKGINLYTNFDTATFYSKLFFCWLNPLLRLGATKELELTDLYPLPRGDRSEYLGNRLDRRWRNEVKKRKPSLLGALIRVFGLKFALLGIFCFIEECGLHIAQPWLLGKLIGYFHPNSTMTLEIALMYASGVVMCSFLYPFTHHPYFFGVNHLGMQVRIACCNLIYRKVLKLSKTALKNTTAGQMVNLLSSDVSRFDHGFMLLHFMWVGPLQSILAGFILWTELQTATFVGMSLVLALLPLQIYMGRIFGQFRLQSAKLGDERIRLTNEVVSGIRIIRMYAWESVFIHLVEIARKNEARYLMKTAMIRAMNMAIYATSTKLIVFLTFTTYLFMGNSLTAEKVFVTVALYNNLRLVMTLFFPFAASLGAETLVSIKRLQKFLLLEEKSYEFDVKKSKTSLIKSDVGIKLENVTASWEPVDKLENATLKNISLDIKPMQLFAVIGPVGSGKTSLLMALLEEIPILKGQFNIKGKIAYSSQEPWIFQATVRQNIIMGNIFNKKRYEEVLKVCALNEDVKRFPFGDLTLVGEKGASLSGGQKARINLARALYVNADIYLLDEPFSAVDTEVAKHLFEWCICKYLKNVVCVLVTHQWQYLRDADQIMIMRDSMCIGLGTYDTLSRKKFDLEAMTKGDVSSVKRTPTELNDKSEIVSSLVVFDDTLDGLDIYHQLPDESKSSGAVGFNLYCQYFGAGGSLTLNTLLVTTTIIAQVLFNGCDLWLSHWTNTIQKHPAEDKRNIFEHQEEKRNLYVYTGIIVGLFVFSLIRCLLFCYLCMRSSIRLHNRMFQAVIRTPIVFFDLNPVGRILNRFSRDIGVLDEFLPLSLDDSTDIAMKIIGIIILVALSNYWVIFPTLFLAFVFWGLRSYYIKTSRALKRLDGITRSPVFSHLSSTLQGLSTVRAFHVEEHFQNEFEKFQDINSGVWFLLICTGRWLAIYLDWISNIFVAITTYSLLFTHGVLGGDAGLAVTSALSVSGIFQWGIRQTAEVESHMISVERIMEYCKLEAESGLEGPPKKKPPPDWPERGEIVFENVSLQYQDDKPILKNLSFVIKASEKIGIVGRTGAGKSSLISSLFRLTEPSGLILIDKVNILQIGLHEIRKNISIIPQEPVLFQNTMRFNLDPFVEHDDEALWNALKSVRLHEYVKELPDGLNTQMSEGGSNISIGQRQLVCLARAILQNNKILVMDEATANVDHETDLKIQSTIREKFRSCTVMTIAHRLNNIIDSDRVMVLHEGELMEFAEPYLLLQKSGSYFDELVMMTGKSTASQLKATASLVYKNKKQ